MCQTHKKRCCSTSEHIWTSNGEDTSKLKTKESELVSDRFSYEGVVSFYLLKERSLCFC